MKNTIKNSISFFGTAIITMATFLSVAFAATPILHTSSPSVSVDSATFSVFYDKNGDVLTSVAVQYGKTTLMQSRTASQTPSSNSGTLSFTANNLTSNTTYYFQAIGVSSTGTVVSSRYTFTTKAINAPSVQTSANPTSIADSSATISGFYNNNGTSLSNLYFEYGTSGNFGQSKSVSISGTSGNVSTVLSGLSANTKYWYRLVATNAGGTTRGSTYTFTTSNNTTNNNYPSCYYNGTCYWDGTKWVSYNNNGNNNNPSCYYNNSCYWDGYQWVNYNNNSNNRNNKRDHYKRPICYYFGTCGNQNNRNNIYVNVNTNNASNISSTSATLSGMLNTNGGNSYAYFEYGTTPNFGRSTNRLYSNNANTNYLYRVEGLSPNTTYYFRIVGESNNKTNVGNIVSFKTNNSGVIVNTTGGTTNTNVNRNNTNTTTTNRNTVSTNNNTNRSTVSGNDTSVQNGSFLAAGAGFSRSFFPGTILGWLIVLLFILIIVMIARRIFSKYTVVRNS